MPKTWAESEVVALIAKEILAYRKDCIERRRPISYPEMAECVYAELNKEGLIEHEP